MKRNSIFLFSILIIVFSSCEKMFNTVIDIDIPHTEGMVLECLPPYSYEDQYQPRLISARTVLSLSNKRKVTGAEKVKAIDNASIYLFENDLMIDSFQKQSGSPYQSGFYGFKPNQKYSITATSPDYPGIKATDVMPNKANISSFQRFAKHQKLVEYDQLEWFDKLTFQIQDDPKPNEHYRLVLSGIVTVDSFLIQNNDTSYYYYYTINSMPRYTCKFVTDPMFERDTYEEIGSSTNCRYEPLFFNDASFNGMSKSFDVYIPSYITQDAAGLPLYVELQIISDKTYKYHKSKAFYDNNQDNPFAEPTQIFSNVENGLGIFGLSSLAVDSLIL